MEVQYNGYIYFVQKDTYETLELLSSRAWFIAKHCPKTIEEFLYYQYYSYYWINVNILGCTYSKDIMRIVEEPKVIHNSNDTVQNIIIKN